MWKHFYVKSKIWHKWTYLEQKQTHKNRELMVAKGDDVQESDELEFGD